METKFNFKSAICTSRLQGEKLLALGLKKETADMTIHIKKDGHWYVTAYPFYEWEDDMNTLPCLEEPDAIIPAWSLHRLWELYWSNKVGSDCLFGCGKHMSPYAKMIAMIEYDIEDGTFNKDYLEK